MKSFLFCTLLMILPFCCSFGNDFTSEFRIGYFYPTSETMRDIYKKGGIEYELELSQGFCDNWQAWLNINYFSRDGRSIGKHDKTSIRLCPLSLGVKYRFQLCENFQFYLGAGGSYTWLNLHDHSAYVKQHGHQQRFGVVCKSGISYTFCECYLLDMFVDYYYTHVSGEHSHHQVHPTARNIGGLRTGLGIGYVY